MHAGLKKECPFCGSPKVRSFVLDRFFCEQCMNNWSPEELRFIEKLGQNKR